MRALALLGLAGCFAPDSTVVGLFAADHDGFYDPQAESYDQEGPFDCDDHDPTVHPGAVDLCDGADNDCNDTPDDGPDRLTFYADGDSDGFGSPLTSQLACEPSDGWVADNHDCNDNDAYSHPGVMETCDDIDEDCDGHIDEEPTNPQTWYLDADGDDHGTDESQVLACDPPDNYVMSGGDCDDNDPSIFPDANETCDGEDEDCDFLVDEDPLDPTSWYADVDHDGYGAGAAIEACEAPEGYTSEAGDCEPDNSAFHPDATEVCEGGDEDCDGLIDEDDPSMSGNSTWYLDSDGDGYGDTSDSIVSCAAVEGRATTGGDCDDSNAEINPAAPEVCDGADNDCNATADLDAVDAPLWFPDADGDGWGDTYTLGHVTSCTAPPGYGTGWSDCDPSEANINPGENEICDDGIDNNCDDEGCAWIDYAFMGVVETDLYYTNTGVWERPLTMTVVDTGDPPGQLFMTLEGTTSSQLDFGQRILDPGPLNFAGVSSGDCSARTVKAISLSSISTLGLALGCEDASGNGTVYLFAGPFEGPIDLNDAAAVIDLGSYGVNALYTTDVDEDGKDELWTVDDYYLREFLPPFAGNLDTSDDYSSLAGPTTVIDFDVNHDGTLDLVWADPEANGNAGKVSYEKGPFTSGVSSYTVDGTWTGENTNHRLGSHLAAGDVNIDGIADLAIGAPGWGTYRGKVYLLDGSTSHDATGSIGAEADASVAGTVSGISTGERLSSVAISDLTRDGEPDLILAAPMWDNARGVVRVIRARQDLMQIVGNTFADFSFQGTTTGDRFGEVFTIGDLDQNGYPDLIVANGATHPTQPEYIYIYYNRGL